jgi:hypothetical protein
MDLAVLPANPRQLLNDEPIAQHGICSKDQVTTFVFGDKSVIIPASVEESFDELSEILRSKDILAEILVLGVTLKIDANTERVVEAHIPENILDMECFMANQVQKSLFDLLSCFSEMMLTVKDDALTLTSSNHELEAETITIDKSSYNSVRNVLAKLLSVPDLPTDFKSSKEIISTLCDDKMKVAIRNSYECVSMGSACSISHKFWDRVQTRAKELGGAIGYTMHHHPIPGILTECALEKRIKMYADFLRWSEQDMKFHQENRIPYFEIRVFGSLENPANPDVGVMRITYKTFDRSSTQASFRPWIHSNA